MARPQKDNHEAKPTTGVEGSVSSQGSGAGVGATVEAVKKDGGRVGN